MANEKLSDAEAAARAWLRQELRKDLRMGLEKPEKERKKTAVARQHMQTVLDTVDKERRERKEMAAPLTPNELREYRKEVRESMERSLGRALTAAEDTPIGRMMLMLMDGQTSEDYENRHRSGDQDAQTPDVYFLRYGKNPPLQEMPSKSERRKRVESLLEYSGIAMADDAIRAAARTRRRKS